MSTPSCRRMPPRRDDLRLFGAIVGHNPQALSGSCHHEAALAAEGSAFGRVTIKQIPRRPRVPLVMTILGEIAAKSGTVSGGFPANYRLCNILPRTNVSRRERKTISTLVSTVYVMAQLAPCNLTPYFGIFCKHSLANQQLARHARKILKTNNFNLNDFNILQICVYNLLKSEILFFYFFSEVRHHGRQNL